MASLSSFKRTAAHSHPTCLVRGTPNPGPPARPEPAYSLHSTDAEDQVTTLHEGLDRCAALLGGILQADATASPSVPTPVTCGAAKTRPSTSLGKKPMKKVPKMTVQRNSPSCPRAAGGTTPRATHASGSPAAHSGVKLHPPQGHTRVHVSPAQPRTSVLQPALQSSRQPGQQPPPGQTEPCPSHTHCNAEEEEEEEEECVPVRDIDTQHAATRTTGGHGCAMEVSTIRQDTHCEGVKTVQYLLGELKALITGQGSVAERLLSHLEQAVSSPLLNDGDSNIQTESVPDMTSLHRQNVQLRRRVQILNQQLKEKEKAERRQNMDSNSEVATLQEEELTAAQSRLQELRRDVAELRTGLQDREAQNALIRTDLEATRSRLVDAEREKSELAALAQQGLEEIGRLKRMLQSRDSSECPAAADTHQPPTEHVARYLMSLGRLGPAAAQRESGAAVHLCDVPPQRGDTPADPPAAPVGRSRCPGEVQPRGWRANSTLSQCDVESLWSDWSARSGSTFDTRDEAAFRDGLAALDASIASLQKTIQLDLRR